LQSIAGSDLLRNVDRQTFVNLVSRTDFSKQDINRIADQLEGRSKWVTKDPQSTITQLFKVCYPEELQSDELGERLEQLIKAGQDTGGKHWFDQPSNATGLKRAPGNSAGKSRSPI